jgi:nucleotide-binding universal stress UspA family protein
MNSTEPGAQAQAHDGPRPVIVALDGSDLASRAIAVGIDIARRRHAPLVLLRAIPPSNRFDMYGSMSGEHSSDHDAAFANFRDTVEQVRRFAPDLHVRGEALEGHPAQEIVAAQRRLGPQLTVMTTHGRSAVARMLRGSVTEAVLRGTEGAMLVTWPWALPEDWSAASPTIGRRILVPLDGSSRTARVLPEAFRLAREHGGELVLLTVLDLHAFRPSRAKVLEQTIRQAILDRATIMRDAGVAATGTLTMSADVPGAVLAAADTHECDLVAMTTHARSPIGRFIFGSVANHVAARAERPVLFTPPHDDESTLSHLYPDVPRAILDLADLPRLAGE